MNAIFFSLPSLRENSDNINNVFVQIMASLTENRISTFLLKFMPMENILYPFHSETIFDQLLHSALTKINTRRLSTVTATITL